MSCCDEYVELISAAVDGALSELELARLEEHLDQCPRCKALYADLLTLHAALEDLPPVEVPQGLTERIMAAVEADNVTPLAPARKKAQPWRRWAAAAAVLAIALVGRAGFSGRQLPPGDSAAQVVTARGGDSVSLPSGQDTLEEGSQVDFDQIAPQSEEVHQTENSETKEEAPVMARYTAGDGYAEAVPQATERPLPVQGPMLRSASVPQPEKAFVSDSVEDTSEPVSTPSPAPQPFMAMISLPEAEPEVEENALVPNSFLLTSAESGEEEDRGELTPQQALDRLLEEYPMPEGAQLVEEEFLGWRGQGQGLGGMVAWLTLEYQSLSSDGSCYEFCLFDNATYAGSAEPAKEIMTRYAVPLDGGNITVEGGVLSEVFSPLLSLDGDALTPEEQGAHIALERLVEDGEGYYWNGPLSIHYPRPENPTPENPDCEYVIYYEQLSANGKYYIFRGSNGIFADLPDGTSEFHHYSLVTFYAVPLDGGEIIKGSGAYFDALMSE